MGRLRREHRMARESVTQGVALACLLLLAGIALAGPSGVLAWGENQRLLQERRQEIQRLTIERDEIRNRVALLDPRNSDSDLAGELVRRNLNVVHPDEMVMLIK
jgi:cell division protein FtsB